MRAFLLTLLVFLLYKGLRREGPGLYASLLILVPAVIILRNFTGERPQLFSFLFVFLLIYLLEGFRRSSLILDSQTRRLKPAATVRYTLYATRYSLYAIPFLMLLWANMHGGFILGNIIIIGYIFSEGMKYLMKRFGPALPLRSLKYLLIAGILSILASLINPNGYNVVPVLTELEKGQYMGMIIEAQSPIMIIRSGFYNQELITYFALLCVCILLFLMNVKRLDLTDIVLFGCFAGLSLSAARVIPFFTPIATLMIARYGSRTMEQMKKTGIAMNIQKRAAMRLSSFKSPAIIIVLSALLSSMLIFLLIKGNLFQDGIRKERYPEGAVKFLKQNRLAGNMFNPYVWGGYLIWELYPDYKVFIDGRGLIEEVFFQMHRVMGASSLHFAGIQEWKAILQAYEVKFIVTFSVNEFTGRLMPLIPAILNDPEWHLIYMDNNSLIFLQESPENKEVIKRFSMPKEWLWNEVIIETAWKAKNFRKSSLYITMGDAFMEKKSYNDAKTAYLKAWEIDPGNSVVKEKLNLLNAYTY